MINYFNNNSICYVFNNICTLSETPSLIVWYKNNINTKYNKAPIIRTTSSINMSHLIVNDSSDRILAATIEDIWYIPVIILLLVIICWICCWFVISKCKVQFAETDNIDQPQEIADIELQELKIDPNQAIIDPMKMKNTNNDKKSIHPKHGSLIYQKRYFSAAQVKFLHDMNIKCLILFGDNDEDKKRNESEARKHFGGQAGVIGQYDRNIGYGIITTFCKSYKNKPPKPQRFAQITDGQFEPLKKYIVSGYDIIIPYPSKQDVKKRYQMYYGDDGHGNNKQVIFHNLGTGIAMLSFDNIYYIQRKIMELQLYAKEVKVVDYYGYDPNMNKPQCPICNEVKVFLMKFKNCNHKMCELCLKQYIDDNLKAYKDNKIDIKFECWAGKLMKCDGHLCLEDVNYPNGTNIYLQQNDNGTILDNKTYKIYGDIMRVYDEGLAIWDKDICPNDECLKPFKIYKSWKDDVNDDDIDSKNSDDSESIAPGKIFHCNCCGDEIHGIHYNENKDNDVDHSSNDDLLEEKYDGDVFFDMFWCNICDKKYCRKCRENCFYSIETAQKNNIKMAEPIQNALGKYQENEGLDCCEICWFKYYCRQCPHCTFKFCGICHSQWIGVTKNHREQQVIYKKIKCLKQAKTVWFIEGGKEKHDKCQHHSCKKAMRIRRKHKSQHSVKLYLDTTRNEEIKALKLQLVGEKNVNQTLKTEINDMKHQVSELSEKKEFERRQKKDIALIEKKIAKIQKKMKKINKETLWEWKESNNVWRLYENETIKKIEKLKVGNYFEYTLSANNQSYRIIKMSKMGGEQINIYSKVRREIRRTERDRNSEAVKYPSFWASINKKNNYVSDGSYAKPHFSKLQHVDYSLWQQVCNRFYATVDNSVSIMDIETVENRFLWDKYFYARNGMKKLMGEHNINEKLLWHGTKYDIIDVICTEGFRKEFNSTHAYGEGTYFARDANYSVSYAKPQNVGTNKYRMFLCSVLCGETATGSNDIKLQNWPKKYDNELIYDSLVDQKRNPSIYVIHDDIRAYPMYIVHFTKY